MSSIDINSGKLVEWIVSRLKMNKDWADKVANIRVKISSALLDMPETEEIKNIIFGTYINYYHCVRILEILKKTECNSRNIFGQYSSKRIKEWQDIVRTYEQGNNYLVDCAQILNQIICFEIPAVKKAIEKNNKTINESVRKEKDCLTTVHESEATLKRLCNTYNIEVDPRRDGGSDDVRLQLRKSTVGLQPMVRNLEEQMKILQGSFDIYLRYVQVTVKDADEICPIVGYLLEKGNTTVYEWKHGTAPVMLVKGDVLDEKESGQTVDEISWDIGLEDEEIEGFSVVDFGIEVEGEKNGARENETKTILEDLETRELLMDDIYELIEFFTSCIDETKTKTGLLLDSIENTDDGRPQLPLDIVETLRNELVTFNEKLTNSSLEHLLMLESSGSYIESIVSRMERERSTLLKYSNLESLLKTRAVEASQDNILQEERLVSMKLQCRNLKGDIESAISKVLGDRVVRIVGEVLNI